MNKEERKNIAYFKRILNIPPNANPDKYCGLYLNNLIIHQIKEDIENEMDDVLGITKQKNISEDYNLGAW